MVVGVAVVVGTAVVVGAWAVVVGAVVVVVARAVVVGAAAVVGVALVVFGAAKVVVVGDAFVVVGTSGAAVSVAPPEQAETNMARIRNPATSRFIPGVFHESRIVTQRESCRAPLRLSNIGVSAGY